MIVDLIKIEIALDFLNSKKSFRNISITDIDKILPGSKSIVDSNSLSISQFNSLLKYIKKNKSVPKCLICNQEHYHFRGLNLNKTCSKTCSQKLTSITSKNTWSCLSVEQKESHVKTIQSGVQAKYGVNNIYELDSTKQKIKKTNVERYGVEHYNKTIENRKKLSETNPLHTEIVKDKIRKTCIDKFGVDNPAKSKDIQLKIQKTCMHRFNSTSYSKSSTFKEKLNTKIYNTSIVPFLERCKIELLDTFKGLSNKDRTGIQYNFLCATCNKRFSDHLYHLVDTFCPYCFPRFQSSYERYLADYFKSLGIDVDSNTRKIISPYEIDLYLKNYLLGIEIHGLYYHCAYDLASLDRLKEYHLTKYRKSKDSGIHLLQFFENELVYKKSICLSIINSKLNISQTKIFARKCQIKIVSNSEIKDFLNKNHIQGYANSSINLGLYQDNDLVQLMTFSKSRYNKKHTYELIRLCSKLNTQIIGGSSKLFKCFIATYLKENETIISYSDNRFFNGSVYSKLGFSISHETSPNYFYWNYGKSLELLSRESFQKHKLKSILKTFDENKTEVSNMLDNNYRIIFDAGHKVWIYRQSLNAC